MVPTRGNAEAPELTDAERSALRYADLMATNHFAVDDSVYIELREHFTEDELVELGMHCAAMTGFGRLVATWDISHDLPAGLRSTTGELFTPLGLGFGCRLRTMGALNAPHR